MRVEKGVLIDTPKDNDVTGTLKTSGAGEGARKRSAGLPDKETCADEEDDEDD